MREQGANVQELFAQMQAELVAWRLAHPEATMDEIAAQVTPRRRQVMGALLAKLALQTGDGYALEGLRCEHCGELMVYKGAPEREVLLSEGELDIARAYYHCPRCKRGLFPPGSTSGAGTPQLDAGDDSESAASWGGHPLLSACGGEL